LHDEFHVYARPAALLTLALMASGCVAAAALPALGVGVMGDAAGGAAKAGVETTLGGTQFRTFSAPWADVRTAVLQSFHDLEIETIENTPLKSGGARITAEALHRKITVQLEPVTPVLTRLKMTVRRGLVGRDLSTSSELIEHTARALAEITPIAGASPRAP
jgi:hypothetical protein